MDFSELTALLPEFEQIADKALMKKSLACFEDAMKTGEWHPGDLSQMPFTLLIPNCSVSFLQHTRAVTRVSIESATVLKEVYSNAYRIDMDELIAGALLHDVGKLLEYELRDQTYQKSQAGNYLRHPFSGVAIARKWDLPDKVLHIIATHAKEGDHGLRCPEAVIVHHADFMNFEPLRDMF